WLGTASSGAIRSSGASPTTARLPSEKTEKTRNDHCSGFGEAVHSARHSVRARRDRVRHCQREPNPLSAPCRIPAGRLRGCAPEGKTARDHRHHVSEPAVYPGRGGGDEPGGGAPGGLHLESGAVSPARGAEIQLDSHGL